MAERQQKKVRNEFLVEVMKDTCFIICSGVTIIYHAIQHRDVFRDQSSFFVQYVEELV